MLKVPVVEPMLLMNDDCCSSLSLMVACERWFSMLIRWRR
jgi:hypothetical protein